MSRLAALSLALLLGACGMAQPAQAPQQTVTLPFHFDRGHVYVAARLNGAELPAVLDTGMPHTVVDSGYARERGLRTLPLLNWMNGQRTAALPGGDLRLGGLKITDLYATDFGGARQALNAPMILGVGGLMDSRIVELDFRAHRLTLHPRPGFVPPAGATLVPLLVQGGRNDRHYGLLLSVKGSPPIRAMIDLGADHALALSPPAARRAGLAADAGSHYAQSTINGDADFGLAQAPVKIAAFDLPDQTVLVARGGNDIDGWEANLGALALARFHLWIDLAGQRMWLTRDPYFLNGAVFTDKGVTSVRPGSPADRAGVKIGDQVRSIDGQPPFDFSQDYDYGSPAPHTYVLTDGRRLTITPESAYGP